jgi:hypothetical protein
MARHPVVLFTVRTYVAPLAQLTSNPQWTAAMAQLLRQLDPAILDYKGITPYLRPLLEHLDRRLYDLVS